MTQAGRLICRGAVGEWYIMGPEGYRSAVGNEAFDCRRIQCSVQMTDGTGERHSLLVGGCNDVEVWLQARRARHGRRRCWGAIWGRERGLLCMKC